MSFLRFAGPEVKALAGELRGSATGFSNAARLLAGADGSSTGTRELASACDHFADSWHYGFGQLSQLVQGISQFADKAAQAFEAVETELVDELRKART